MKGILCARKEEIRRRMRITILRSEDRCRRMLRTENDVKKEIV